MGNQLNNNSRHSYETVSEAMHDLIKRGYTTDFLLEMEHEHIKNAEGNITLSPDEFEIDEVFRFEGFTDPADESILFAISSKDNTVKGFVLNSFGAEFGYRSSRLVEHLKTHL